ncbi:MAG: hypothetical protein ABI658_31400 [Acidimicrobiales bacterium]
MYGLVDFVLGVGYIERLAERVLKLAQSDLGTDGILTLDRERVDLASLPRCDYIHRAKRRDTHHQDQTGGEQITPATMIDENARNRGAAKGRNGQQHERSNDVDQSSPQQCSPRRLELSVGDARILRVCDGRKMNSVCPVRV